MPFQIIEQSFVLKFAIWTKLLNQIQQIKSAFIFYLLNQQIKLLLSSFIIRHKDHFQSAFTTSYPLNTKLQILICSKHTTTPPASVHWSDPILLGIVVSWYQPQSHFMKLSSNKFFVILHTSVELSFRIV